ncbi:unnamed protein product [Prorocentrum cordatum]|uniref:Uncharacterized protein n=1 Tax=Prorocentrum cordatum TaxID=2364126 RepID=A0ABN9TTW9_9DINO|nr:unnamed protein product [Polarella glacialis]
MSTATLDRKHHIVDCSKSYQEFVKQRKEDPKADVGSPASQAACSILLVLKDGPFKDTSARRLKVSFGITWLSELIQHTGPDQAALWIKEAAVSRRATSQGSHRRADLYSSSSVRYWYQTARKTDRPCWPPSQTRTIRSTC